MNAPAVGGVAPLCFITQPVDDAARQVLCAAGWRVRVASSPTMATVVREIGDATAVITRDLGLDAAAMRAAPGLRIVASHGVGTNRIDLEHARHHGIRVVNTPGTNTRAVAEYTLGLMIAAARRLVEADGAVRQGAWDFRYAGGMRQLSGCVLGLAGFGAIGRMVADMCHKGLGMEVIAWSPNTPDDVFATAGVQRVPTLDRLLRRADIVSLHRPLRPDTERMINAATLALMKPDAIMLNTGRGGLVDDAALAAALKAGKLGAAALDVFAVEPLPADSPLLDAPRLVLSPHLAGTSDEALRATASCCARQILQWQAGEMPRHVVV
ncbi:NAD(P)-dependent oxidoreductase [Komagataeibacter melomenusus]